MVDAFSVLNNNGNSVQETDDKQLQLQSSEVKIIKTTKMNEESKIVNLVTSSSSSSASSTSSSAASSPISSSTSSVVEIYNNCDQSDNSICINNENVSIIKTKENSIEKTIKNNIMGGASTNHKEKNNLLNNCEKNDIKLNCVTDELIEANLSEITTTTTTTTKNCKKNHQNVKLSQIESQQTALSDMDQPSSSSSSSTSTSSNSSIEQRRVEPLKLNLNREPIKTIIKIPSSQNDAVVPKITIKPIVKTDLDIVPKLHLSRVQNLNDEIIEPHIVPKLTIRNVTTTSENNIVSTTETHHTIVPKLTIKMDNHSSYNESTFIITKDEQQQQQQQPPLPKLTIKTNINDSMSNNSSIHPKLTIKPIPKPPESTVVVHPKLTIKPIIKPEEESTTTTTTTFPKLIIKPIPKPPIIIEQNSEMNETIPKITIITETTEQVPKLTIRTTEGCSSSHLEESIPKIIVRVQSEIIGGNEISSPPIVPKLTIRTVNKTIIDEQQQSIVIPKVTIKPIIDPNSDEKQSNTLITPKVTLKPIPKPIDLTSNLEIVTTTTTTNIQERGLDSPRIVLKINKSNLINQTPSSPPTPPPPLPPSSFETIEIEDELECFEIPNKLEKNVFDLKRSATTAACTQNDDKLNSITRLDNKKPKLTHPASIEIVDLIEDDDSQEETITIKDDEDDEFDVDLQESKTRLKGILSTLKRTVREDTKNNILLINESSSSDYILLEDNLTKIKNCDSDLMMTTTIEKDSGVESTKSGSETIEVVTPPPLATPIKRGRGRPRKIPLPEDDEDFCNEKKMKTAGDDYSEENGEEGSSPKKDDIKRFSSRDHNDDDCSPTFHPTYRLRGRGRGRGSRGGRGSRSARGKRRGGGQFNQEKDGVIWSTPDAKDSFRKKLNTRELFTPALQVFEEDTRMSADLNRGFTPGRQSDFWNNDESQSSMQSSMSNTVEYERKKRSKMEVGDHDGKTDFSVDMIAEYEWPQPTGNIPAKNRDTFMIQEQVAEFLGVKSFKRKYPDIIRRPVEMEERNYLMEKQLVSEKMCDLGLTAVSAADCLDIIYQDFHDKYEDYKRYHREKQARDFSNRQRALRNNVDKSQSARDKALDATSNWNSMFNKDRQENRRACVDLQSLIVQFPETRRDKMSRPVNTASNYPIALVPGQFSEYYKKYTSTELCSYPINSVLLDPIKFNERLLEERLKENESQNDSDSSSSSGSSSSDSDSDSLSDGSESDSSSSSDSDENEPPPLEKCRVCSKTQNSNQNSKPECFIKCTSCRGKAHPSCIEMSPRMSKRAAEYSWQCSSCKSCFKCHRTINDDKMLFCDQCDRGYHIYCIGLRVVPEGRWHCNTCSICTVCGVRNPEGHPNSTLTQLQKQQLAMCAKWTHEYRVNHITKIREHCAMLCVPCARLKNSC